MKPCGFTQLLVVTLALQYIILIAPMAKGMFMHLSPPPAPTHTQVASHAGLLGRDGHSRFTSTYYWGYVPLSLAMLNMRCFIGGMCKHGYMPLQSSLPFDMLDDHAILHSRALVTTCAHKPRTPVHIIHENAVKKEVKMVAL